MPLESPLAYNMYLFNLRIANHILIKIYNRGLIGLILIRLILIEYVLAGLVLIGFVLIEFVLI